MEKCPICITNEQTEEQNKLAQTRLEVEKITDKLGKGIEQGIKETVTVLRAMDLETSSSCAGHREPGENLGLPYVEIYSPAPAGWKEDKQNQELREEWRQSNFKQRAIIQPLLDEFNKTRNVTPDALLHMSEIGAFGGFRIENVGGTNPSLREDAEKTVTLYQQEMAAFTKFIKEKYLTQK